jgi:transketolase
MNAPADRPSSDLHSLTGRCASVRRRIIDAIFHAQTGHAGPSLSMVEVLVVLYFRILNRTGDWETKDWFILSKGHGSPGLYAVLAEAGLIQPEELLTLRALGSRLQGHPCARSLPLLDFSTGSLGQGLSLAVGVAFGLRRKNYKGRVYCVLGDGELQEGQNWEAAMSAAAYRLGTLVAIVDRNRLQSDGPTEEIMPMEDIAAKFAAFGWQTIRIDGHDLAQVEKAMISATEGRGRPTVIIADTVKGKGISFMEGKVQWHHYPLSSEKYSEAISLLQKA